MRKICCLLLLMSFNIFSRSIEYRKFGTRLEKNIRIEGYPVFDYVFWLHPGSSHGERESEVLFTKKTLDFLRTIIPVGSVAIDIGAHAGDTSVLYSLVVGQTGKVIAFEPNPLCFEVLKMNAANHKNILAVESAITEDDGNYTFHYTDLGLCNGGFAAKLSLHPYTVPVNVNGVNFERWLEKNAQDLIPRIKYIKIDTEGYDRYIIKSIRNFLLKYRPLLQCELYIYLAPQEKAEIFDTLNALNYKIVLSAYEGKINTSPIQERTIFSRESLINYQIPEGSVDLLCIPAEQYDHF